MAGFFSLFALLLACLGLYGIMSQAVLRRTREIGVRMALGARRRDVIVLVLRESMALVVIGVVIGLGAALMTTRFISNFLYGMTHTDPLTLAIAVISAILAFGYARSFVRRRLRFVNAVQNPVAPIIVAVVAALPWIVAVKMPGVAGANVAFTASGIDRGTSTAT